MLYLKKNPHGGDIYSSKIKLDFSENTNPFGTPEGVKDAIINSIEYVKNYPDPYARELVNAISLHEDIKSEYIFLGNGAAELIYTFLNSVKPKNVLLTAPSFSEYETASRSVGAKIDRFYLLEENEFELKEDYLSNIKNKEYDVIFLCNPNNPTGNVIKKELLSEIIKISKESNTWVFLDECFLNLTEDSYSMKDELNAYDNLFILRAFTKDYAMAGLRLGYSICSNIDLLKKMSENVQCWNISIVAQKAGVAALKEDKFLKESTEYIFKERERVSAKLKEMNFKVFNSKGNFILFKGDKELGAKLKLKGIQIRDCSNYYGLNEGYYRIGIKLKEANDVLLKEIQEIEIG